MTNAIERLGMRWKEKSLTIVAGPFTEYKPGGVVEIVSNSGTRWIWRVAWTHWSMWHRISKANPMFLREEGLVLRPQTAGQEAY